MTRVTVERVSEDGLSKTEWTWWVDVRFGVLLHLDHYYEMSRPTKRHKFRADEQWHRLSSEARNNTIRRDRIHLPEDVKTDARRKVEALIEFAVLDD